MKKMKTFYFLSLALLTLLLIDCKERTSKVNPVEANVIEDTIASTSIIINDTVQHLISEDAKSVLDVLRYYKIKFPNYYYSRIVKEEIEPGGYYKSLELFTKDKSRLFFCSFNRNITPTKLIYYQHGGADSSVYLFNGSERTLIKLD